MSPRSRLTLTALGAALAVAAFVWLLPPPVVLPAPMTSILAAGLLAALATLAIAAWMPPRWLWTESEQVRIAFQARHGLSDSAATAALAAITETHARATTLRRAAQAMRPDVAQRVEEAADRLDLAARDIFYTPDRHRQLRAVLVRAQLIEDAATGHAKLRARAQPATEEASRAKLLSALEALMAAFAETDLRAAQGLLAQVDAASEVAERLLKPNPIT
ncbi:MAG: hypothetical protein ACU0CI_11890 [Shimia sp.]